MPLHYLPPGSLVRFRCFIQDMFDPEFYTGAYEAADPTTGAKVSASSPPRARPRRLVHARDSLSSFCRDRSRCCAAGSTGT